jgi:hypothetical protein
MLKKSVLRRSALVALVALAVGACGDSGLTRDEATGEVAESTSVSLSDVIVGDCVRDETEVNDVTGTIELTPCADVHNAQAFYLGEADGADDYDRPAVDKAIAATCAEEFGSFLASPVSESEYVYYWYAPTREAWDGGDHGFTCYVWADGEDITGSLERQSP